MDLSTRLAALLVVLSAAPVAAQRDPSVSRPVGRRDGASRAGGTWYERERQPSHSVSGSGYFRGGSWTFGGFGRDDRDGRGGRDDGSWRSPYRPRTPQGWHSAYDRPDRDDRRDQSPPRSPYGSWGYRSDWLRGSSGPYYPHPPIGGVVRVLPPSTAVTVYGGATYYMLDGQYYRRAYYGGNLAFAAVPPPLGSIVYVLPLGCQPVIIRGATYYIGGGAYYRPIYYGGRLAYQVVAQP